MTGRAVIGLPEFRRLAEGKPVTIRIRPGTTELAISLSLIARGNLKLTPAADPIDAAIADLIGRLHL